MAGKIVPIIPKTRYSFNGVASSSTTVNIGPRAVSTADWRSGVISVRVHAGASWGSTSSTVEVRVYNAYISSEDPNTVFLNTTTPPYVATASITNGTATGTNTALLTVSFNDPIGPMLAVQIVQLQGANLGATTLDVSVDLLGRDN